MFDVMKPAIAHENTSGGGDDGSAPEGMASLTPIRSLAEGLSRDYLLHHKLCPIGEQADGSIVVAMAPGAIRDGLTDIAFAYRSTVHTQPVRIDGVLTPAPPMQLQHAVVSRIKLLAELDISERSFLSTESAPAVSSATSGTKHGAN